MLLRNVSDHLQKIIFGLNALPGQKGTHNPLWTRVYKLEKKNMTDVPTRSNMIGCFSPSKDGSAGWFSNQEVHGIRMVNTMCVREEEDSADIEALNRCS